MASHVFFILSSSTIQIEALLSAAGLWELTSPHYISARWHESKAVLERSILTYWWVLHPLHAPMQKAERQEPWVAALPYANHYSV